VGYNLQEIFRPDIFWYSAPTQIQLPFNIVGLVAFELFAMHWCAGCRQHGTMGLISPVSRS